MRKLFVLMIAFLTISGFYACEKDVFSTGDEEAMDAIALASNKTEITVENLPSIVQSFLDELYFETYVEAVFKSDGNGFEVQLGNGELVYFDEDGEPLTGALTRGDCERPHRKGGKKGKGTRDGFGERDSTRTCSDNSIAIEELSATITDYITANYPEAEIRKAKLKTAEDGADLIVVGLSDHVILVFDGDGNFIEEKTFVGHCGGRGTPVAFEELSQVILDYISTNYETAEFRKAFEKEEGTIVVGLYVDGEKIVLGFDADGNLIFEKTGRG